MSVQAPTKSATADVSSVMNTTLNWNTQFRITMMYKTEDYDIFEDSGWFFVRFSVPVKFAAYISNHPVLHEIRLILYNIYMEMRYWGYSVWFKHNMWKKRRRLKTYLRYTYVRLLYLSISYWRITDYLLGRKHDTHDILALPITDIKISGLLGQNKLIEDVGISTRWP